MSKSNKNEKLTCFKTYDIRGRLGRELNEDIATRIAMAFADFLKPLLVVVGCDARESSEPLKQAVINGLNAMGVDTIDLGLTGSEEVYFATRFLQADGGIEITASHNPIEYNGMKLVGVNAVPISTDSGLDDIKVLAERGSFEVSMIKGASFVFNIAEDYSRFLLGFVDITKLKPLKVVVNSGNGAAGHMIDELERQLIMSNAPVEFIKIGHEADSRFPNGIPNPLVPQNRTVTSSAVVEHSADIGVAWDGDFDRCFIFDEKGQFIESYYVVGLLAEQLLRKTKGGKVIIDPRLIWNSLEVIEKNGGIPVVSKTGHSFIKERMKVENAIFGGEMSGHYYFRDFGYCDSGMIPWLLIVEMLSIKGTMLSKLVFDRISAFPCSSEINYIVPCVKAVLAEVEKTYKSLALSILYIDGISCEFTNWRFNLRASNTESLLRLNIESRGDRELVVSKLEELSKIIGRFIPRATESV